MSTHVNPMLHQQLHHIQAPVVHGHQQWHLLLRSKHVDLQGKPSTASAAQQASRHCTTGGRGLEDYLLPHSPTAAPPLTHPSPTSALPLTSPIPHSTPHPLLTPPLTHPSLHPSPTPYPPLTPSLTTPHPLLTPPLTHPSPTSAPALINLLAYSMCSCNNRAQQRHEL